MTRPRGPRQAAYLPGKSDADRIERAATQVRAGRVVHTRVHSLWTRDDGHHYQTGCGLTVYGAVLTSHYTTCADCLEPVARPDPLLEALP